MIIIGYQGIGKSSAAGADNGYIDLESSNFWVDGVRPRDWYKYYCKIALDLSKQGYVVFTSSHKEVRDYFLKRIERDKIVAVFPAKELESAWIAKLGERFRLYKSEKNYKALMNAKDRFKENIDEMENWGGEFFVIDDMSYVLKDIVEELKK